MTKKEPINLTCAEYQRQRRMESNQALLNFKKKRWERLVEYAKPLKEVLKKYRPDYEPPPEAEPPKKSQPRKRWILGVD